MHPSDSKDSNSDKKTFLDFLNGNNEAFELIVTRYQDRLFSFFYRTLYNADDAQELTQEVFLALIKYKHRNRFFEFTASFKTFLYRIARYRLISHRRKKRKRIKHVPLHEIQEIIPDKTSQEPVRIHENIETIDIMSSCLQALPERQRIAIILYYVEEDMTYKEIGSVLGVSHSTVRRDVIVACKILAERIRKEMGD